MADSLELEIKEFVSNLPYWAKCVSVEILSGKHISETIIDNSFQYLLEDLDLSADTEKPEISFEVNHKTSSDFKENIRFTSLKNVEGVNALIEKQTIEFSHNLTIIYGVNSAGKSGYIRLLKNAFYSKDKGQILKNINQPENPKEVKADFYFNSDNKKIFLEYPENSTNGIFNQFAVFDGIIGNKHLTDRNDFSFRPAGLSLFNKLNAVLEKLQTKINSEIQLHSIHNPFSNNDVFQDDSAIKTFLISLAHDSDIVGFQEKHLPYTENDKKKRVKIEKEFDDLKIAFSQKNKEIQTLKDLRTQIIDKKKHLQTTNQYFNQEYLDSISDAIKVCKAKQNTAKKDGIDKFKTDKIKNSGTPEWKQFIKAAEVFALNQKDGEEIYPAIGDNCLLCQQPILEETSQKLIRSYWDFIKSCAEQEAVAAKENIEKIKTEYINLDLVQFPETDTLAVWLKEHHLEAFSDLKLSLSEQKTLSQNIVLDIQSYTANNQIEIQIDLTKMDKIREAIDRKINTLTDDEKNSTLDELKKQKDYLSHKDKLQQRIAEVEKLHQNMIWINKANMFNKQYWKKHSTDTEKRLSRKYFNNDYINEFNQECAKLDGNFGIDIDARSSDGQSNRQLFLKGLNPTTVLSEGEQKVIALADFIAETSHSDINKGILFDDPVNSLDDERKSKIAERLVKISQDKQVVIFTHDLVFVSSLINTAEEIQLDYQCHWIEKSDNEVGKIWLNNAPSYEKKYKKSGVAQSFYEKTKNSPPEEKETLVKSGFAALRSSYEAFVIFDLFSGVVQRFNDRVSIDSLKDVVVNDEIVSEILKNFGLACRYIEGHSHSDKFLSKKPTPKQLIDEIQRFNDLKKKIKDLKNQKISEGIQ